MKKKYYLNVLAVLILAFLTFQLQAQDKGKETIKTLKNYWVDQYSTFDTDRGFEFGFVDTELKAKADPDGCFFGVGNESNYFNPLGIDCDACEVLGGRPKTNQSYVWGLTQEDDKLFFGTGQNIQCFVLGAYIGLTAPIEAGCWVCEFGESAFSPPLPATLGDWRPSRMFAYDKATGENTDITPNDPSLQTTVGIRSAGSLDGVVLLGGPSILGGITIYAYTAADNDFIDSYTMSVVPGTAVPITNIRKWLIVDDIMYLGIGTVVGGSILKWTGSLENPFMFELVGNIEGQAAELTEHEDRIFVTTWPEIAGKDVSNAGLWMSPVIPEGGLTSANIDQWDMVWTVMDYEVDPVCAYTYGGGALKSFGGYLYWGTMHVPLSSTFAHFLTYPPQTLEDTLATVLGSHRAISIFRGSGFGDVKSNIELLYGNEMLPQYTPGSGWAIVPNNMGQAPLFGPSGFGNLFNNYTWTMDEYEDELYVGTMDFSFLVLGDLFEMFAEAFSFGGTDGITEFKDLGGYEFPSFFFGADLFKFTDPYSMAYPVSLDGIGNEMNYGVRTMVSDDNHLYLGTANPMNIDPDGGWEIIEATKTTVTIDPSEYTFDRVARNKADETFFGLGDPRNNFNPKITHYTTDSTIAKHNQSYVWGMASAKDNVWFGTGPNVLQLVMGAYLQMPTPQLTDSWAAEFGLSQFSPPYPDVLGDWRPAQVFMYDDNLETNVEKTPSMDEAPLLQTTLGLRSAGTIGPLVILGGPNVALDFGVNFLAYNSATGEFLGNHQIKTIDGDEINNIRKWVEVDGEVYTGISGESHGFIIKWTGTVADPFQYEVVGKIDAAPAEFTIHEGRIVTSCWPGGGELGSPVGGLPSVWVSPEIPSGGLTTAHQYEWFKIWESSDYEVDPLMARMMAGGAIESHDGYIYWGTMHVPFMATLAHLKVYFEDLSITPTTEDIINAIINTHRAISIFRAKDITSGNPEIELCYGEEMVSAYSPYTGWLKVPNASGLTPLYGPSGFGSPFNNYTWTMDIFDDQLFIGTMDWSYLIGSMVPALIEDIISSFAPDSKIEISLDDLPLFHIPIPFEGADLWTIATNTSIALPVSFNGLGNKRNYGIRTMTTTDDKLFLGMANAMNVHPEGGWELYALTGIDVDFAADKPIANPYNTITFHPEVDGNQLYTTSWEFPGGSPSYSEERTPEVYYENEGNYDATLHIQKIGQSFTVYKDDYITIEPIDQAQCQEYYEGWGAISSYMSPYNPNLVDMMEALINNPQFGEMVVLLGENGIFWPSIGINTLVNWDSLAGYKVKMTEFAGNCVFGEPITQTDVTVPAGVHFLPVLSMEAVDADELFEGAPLIYAYNLYNGEFYWPEGAIYTLETLYPGIAYLVGLTSEHTFHFPEIDKSQKILPQMPEYVFDNPTTIWETPVNTGNAHIFSVYNESLAEMKTGDVIGAFNAMGECIGMSEIKSTTENLALVVYGDDPTTTENEGSPEGDMIQFRVLSNGQEKQLIAEFDKRFTFNNGRYATNGYSGINEFKENPDIIATTHIPGLEIYPNPANNQLHIVCPRTGEGTISIFSIQGKLVTTVDLTDEKISLNIGHLENGIYILKITSNQKVVTKRIVKE